MNFKQFMTLRKNDIDLLNTISFGDEQQPSTAEHVSIYQGILEVSDQWSLEYSNSGQESFESILKKLNLSQVGKKYSLFRTALVIAASISIIIASYLTMLNVINNVEIENGMAEIKTMYLPDSSKVVLNADSYLSYNKANWKEGNRELSLSGHAYFEVKKGSEFKVNSSKGMVSVLGTSFNVLDRKDVYEVECLSGKVKVSAYNSSTILTKGLKTSIHPKVSQLKKAVPFDVGKSKEWTQGIFNYYNTPIKVVFDEIGRQFGVEVEINVQLSKSYSGTFKNANLEQSLINVCKPLGFIYKYENNNKIIINKSQTIN